MPGGGSAMNAPPPSTRFLSLPRVYVLLSPVVPISIRYLTFHMENLSQNGLRMTSGAMALLLLALVRHRAELMAQLRSPRAMLLLSLYGIAIMICMYTTVEGMARTSAAMGGLVGVVGIPISVLLAAVFYGDERAVLKNPRFIVGMLVALTGTAGVTLTAHEARLSFSIGVLYLLFSVTIWSFATVLVKHLLKGSHPFVTGGVSVLVPGLLFLALAGASGQLAVLPAVASTAIAVAIGSGVVGIIAGVGMYLVLLKRMGISKLNVLGLASPVLTAAVAYPLLGDTMSIGQVLFSLVVLAGCWLSFRGPQENTKQKGSHGNPACIRPLDSERSGPGNSVNLA